MEELFKMEREQTEERIKTYQKNGISCDPEEMRKRCEATIASQKKLMEALQNGC